MSIGARSNCLIKTEKQEINIVVWPSRTPMGETVFVDPSPVYCSDRLLRHPIIRWKQGGSCGELSLSTYYVVVGMGFQGFRDQNTRNTFPGWIRNTTLICSDNNEVNETMLRNIQSLSKQNVDSVQYTISADSPTNESPWELEGNLHESQGDYQY